MVFSDTLKREAGEETTHIFHHHQHYHQHAWKALGVVIADDGWKASKFEQVWTTVVSLCCLVLVDRPPGFIGFSALLLIIVLLSC